MLSDTKSFERRHVLYCDILGFSAYTQSEFFESSHCFKLFYHLDELLHQAQEEIDPTTPDPTTGQVPDYVITPEATYCSDSIIISLPSTNTGAVWLCEAAARLQNQICFSGFLLRGAIVTGDVYHSGNTIFGPAIVEAVHLEHDAAVPSIILSEESYEIFHYSETPDDAEIVKIRSRQLISNYRSKQAFIDPFWLLKCHVQQPIVHPHSRLSIDTWRSRIEHGLMNKNPRIYSKYLWVAELFNHSLCNNISNIRPISLDARSNSSCIVPAP
jgi:hypothetical protein